MQWLLGGKRLSGSSGAGAQAEEHPTGTKNSPPCLVFCSPWWELSGSSPRLVAVAGLFEEGEVRPAAGPSGRLYAVSVAGSLGKGGGRARLLVTRYQKLLFNL